MAINWGAARQGQNDLLNYFQMGQQIGQQIVDKKVNKALGRVLAGQGGKLQGAPMGIPVGIPGTQPNGGASLPTGMGGGLVATPEQEAETARMQALYPNAPQFAQDGRTNALDADMQTIARHNPQLFMQLQQRQAQAEEAARKRQQEQVAAQRTRLTETAKLFEGVTPENYGQRLALAQQLGIDTSAAPQSFDPAWVQQNAQIMRFAVDKPDELSGIAKELVNAGYQPDTPQFKSAMASVINSKYAAEYVDEFGNTRRRSALNVTPGMPQQAPQQVQAQEPISYEMYVSAAQGLGPQGSLDWIKSNNIPVRVSSPQQAQKLPRGTRLILPDGTEGVVP